MELLRYIKNQKPKIKNPFNFWFFVFGLWWVGSAPATSQAAYDPAVVGPQPSITCPAGAINITPGTNIQNVVNANLGTATFCLKAGIHTLAGSIIPKTGNTFIGEYGAIMDGTGWSTTDESAAAFRGPVDIDNVTIKNLVIRNMPQKGIWADRDRAQNWTVENNELSYNKYGFVLTAGMMIRRNKIHHNTIGGYTFYMTNLFPGTSCTMEGNEIGYNGGDQAAHALGYFQKAIDSGTIFWRSNWVHHNVAAGIWNDGDGNGSIIEDNIIEDNERGIHWEGSVNGIIRGNILRRNSDQGIYLSTARDTLVENNVLEDNFRGIVIFINCFTTMQGWAWAPDLRNDTIRNNTTKMSTAPGEIPAIFSWAAGHFNGSTQDNGCTDPQVQPYLDNTKNNWFSGNKYYVTDVNGWLWYWVSSKNFSAWKTLGQDTTGSVYPVSQYSTQSTFSPCDVSQDNATNVADVQLCVNQGLGSLACGRGDINKDGFCNVVDVQRVVNAALGGQCVSP